MRPSYCWLFVVRGAVLFVLAAGVFVSLSIRSLPICAQQQQIVWTDQEKPILEKIRTLRKLDQEERARTTKQLALQIRQLPAGINKVRLANMLANLSTEGDFGHDMLQEVATTLQAALREAPVPATPSGPPAPYVELAQLVRYEHVQAAMDVPQYAAAVAKLEADDARNQHANFSLLDLSGKRWTLQNLHGNVVLVNFWATWCPPCRSEMPDLQALYEQFKNQGFIVLAISDEPDTKVTPFIEQFHYTYPILLDPDRKVHEAFGVEGIPKSFVYDREGNLVTQSIDMRTKRQFLEMLAHAGLH
ncbi:MAG TPA: TlpA disulfide reductase family protein [Candidatus Eremiobacteraceae bacterium]|nr:TlpA disulfide reductase family protein [Candidatus Eremiobacteraceae bacterium]